MTSNTRENHRPLPTAPPLNNERPPIYEAPPPYSFTEHYNRPMRNDTPPGLEYLSQIDQLIVKQKIEILEVMTGFETNNQYDIHNSVGQNIFFAHEDTDPVTRNCLDQSRPFEMKVFDNNKIEALHFSRPLKCSHCCFPCCLQQLEVAAPPGNRIGCVLQKWSLFQPYFEICDGYKNPILYVEGPMITWSFGNDVTYKIFAMDGVTKIGEINKQWGGMVKEMFTDADTFSISFPLDLDVTLKATLLGACILIDFMYYEEVANKNNQRKPRRLRDRYYTNQGSRFVNNSVFNSNFNSGMFQSWHSHTT